MNTDQQQILKKIRLKAESLVVETKSTGGKVHKEAKDLLSLTHLMEKS